MFLIDSHVHIYNCFDVEMLFTSAYNNFAHFAKLFTTTKHFTGVLALAETSKVKWFDYLARQKSSVVIQNNNNTSNWSIYPTKDDFCLRVQNNNKKIYLIAGRQVVTEENLEVLALFSNRKFNDGHPLKWILREISESGALPVIAWGFGKWLGKRGSLVNNAIEYTEMNEFFLGKTLGRPLCLPEPSQFKLGRTKGIRTLGGTDPLPLKFQEKVVGSFGNIVHEDIDEDFPGQCIQMFLQSRNAKIKPYGRQVGMIDFGFNQYRLLMKTWNRTQR